MEFRHETCLAPDGTEEDMDIFAFNESEKMGTEPFRVHFIPKGEKAYRLPNLKLLLHKSS
ncbi:hypothetical protein BKA56DRAFT_681219 [Ilyonectria sp. MPI-CAGE-AT-0026]|nr:hypothetical protein BKA56DRAFT_681219 [Ilyonectria sp. MPI-CAGE-AT-0026]